MGTLAGCGEASIFPNIPLTTDPLVLANPISMVASAVSNRLYVVNSNNRVLWFDASFVIMDITNPISPVAIVVVSLPNFSGQIILDEARGFVYIPNRLSTSEADEEDQVLRININEASPSFLAMDLIPSAANSFGASFDGTRLFVACTEDALQYNVDSFLGFTSVNMAVVTNEGRELDAMATRELSISPSGNNLFVTNELDNMLILNLSQFPPPSVPGETDLGQEGVDYIVTGSASTRGTTTDSSFVYVVSGAPDALQIMTDTGLDPVVGAPVEIPASALIVGSIPVGTNPGEVIVDEPKMRAYVSNTGDDTVSIIDLNLEQEIARISVQTTDETQFTGGNFEDGDQPFGMALINIGGTNYLYVAHFITNLISVINVDTLTLVNQFPPQEV